MVAELVLNHGVNLQQVSGLAQSPDDLKFIEDQESNTYKSGGVTLCILCQSSTHTYTRKHIAHMTYESD